MWNAHLNRVSRARSISALSSHSSNRSRPDNMDGLDSVLAPTKAMVSGGRAAEGVVDESAQALLTLASAASPNGKPTPAPGQGFACSICQKHFNKSSDMKRHKKSHTGERPFNCLTCQKAFLKVMSLGRSRFLI